MCTNYTLISAIDNNCIKYPEIGDNTQLIFSEESIAKHQYLEPGVYEICVTAVDKDDNNRNGDDGRGTSQLS